jgi:hypothetical protein
MSDTRYRPGDAIALRPRTLGGLEPQRMGRIVSVLPETRGSICYRVRFQNENFDRSVSQDDIDPTASTPRDADNKSAVNEKSGSSWINLNSIKTKK